MIPAILMLVAVSFVVAVPLVVLARGMGRRMNAFDAPGVVGQVKVAARRVPNTGGMGVFWTVALLVGAALVVFNTGLADAVIKQIPALAPHLPGLKTQTPGALALLGCLLALHITGVIDDRKPLGPMPKLLVMAGAAAAAVWFTDTRLLTLLDGHVGGPWLSILLTVVWLVAVTNAFNFIDNMDGLCGGVAAICGACFLASALLHGQWFVAALLAILVGACVAFLLFNFPRAGGATVFLGDGGSLIIGFLLGLLAVRITYTSLPPESPIATGEGGGGHWHAVLTPLVVLAVPLYDMVSVTVIRHLQGKSPFVGDLQHLSHRLNFRGMSKRAAVLMIYGLTAITATGGIILSGVRPWEAGVIFGQTVMVLAILGVYEYRASRPPRGGENT